MRGIFGVNYKEFEDIIISRLDVDVKPKRFLYKKEKFPYLCIKKEHENIGMLILVREPNPNVFGGGGRLRELISDYAATENSKIAVVAENDPDNILKNLHKNISTLIVDFRSNHLECILAKKGYKDLVMLYNAKEDTTLTYWNNDRVFNTLLNKLKPLIERIDQNIIRTLNI